MIHIERLPYYPDLIRRGEIDASFTGELLQLFPCTATYICRAEIVEKQQGIDSAIKVINEAMEYGGKFRAHRNVDLWNKKMELFIKAKDPVNAFLTYILSCHNAQIRKFPEELYEKMMVQLERDQEYGLQISADQLIFCQAFKAANIFSCSTRQPLQIFNQLAREAQLNCKNSAYIFPIKEMNDILSKHVKIEFLPSQSDEQKFVISKFGDSPGIKQSDQIAVWKVHSNISSRKLPLILIYYDTMPKII